MMYLKSNIHIQFLCWGCVKLKVSTSVPLVSLSKYSHCIVYLLGMLMLSCY